VVVGLGGTEAELFKDIAVAPAPVGRERARRMLQSLRLWPLLAGWRGRPALDVDAAAEAVSRLSFLAEDLGERLVDFEINPLIVARAGAVAVDARGLIAGEAS
jgi:hypothetical protein